MTDRTGADQPASQPYIALVVMEATTSSPAAAGEEEQPLYQENIVLVHATDERSARERVERRARQAETSYVNDRQETVTWQLRAIVDVKEAEDTDLGRDADLYTRHFRDWAAYERVEPLLARDSDGASRVSL
ncbi:DUF4288 domain-containing protein [Streptomyces caelestis]|uniref:DUF4288 domain-containing protein n=1 Tax=Streptomyces caelestis TaxID=36816 RepID=A0A7W9HDV2_9ACTN|nr:DUF4288 domain-containing protein [Streptomyces caelestis]MBB5800108.1 hypothetical protein [Streptomyces caelestis]GGW86603.1 hypothetical protein GCM10010320_80230 [Streptomyces caelestis]